MDIKLFYSEVTKTTLERISGNLNPLDPYTGRDLVFRSSKGWITFRDLKPKDVVELIQNLQEQLDAQFVKDESTVHWRNK